MVENEYKKIFYKTTYDKASFLSKLFFAWVTPVFITSCKRQISEKEMFNISYYESADYLTDHFKIEWDKEINKSKPSLLKSFMRFYWKRYALLGLLALFDNLLQLLQAVFIWQILIYAHQPQHYIDRLIGFSSAYVVSIMVLVLVRNPYFFLTLRDGMHLKVGMSGLIYDKLLRLNQKSLTQTSTGQLINLLSNDVRRFELCLPFLHYIWIGPLVTVITTGILYYLCKEGGIAAIILFIFLIPLQLGMGHLFTKARQKMAVITDERIKVVSELLNGMKVIKMYCWETMFHRLIKKLRRREIKCIRRTRIGLTSSFSQLIFQPKIAMLLLVSMAYLRNIPLSSQVIFSSMILLNFIRFIFTKHIPYMILNMSEVYVTFQRIQKFLLLPELGDQNISNKYSKVPPNDSVHEQELFLPRSNSKLTMNTMFVHPATFVPTQSVEFDHVYASWDTDGLTNVLNNVSFKLEGPQICAVVGHVGNSKSSLLMALLGELPLSRGHITVHGSLSYAPQQPWLYAGTIRENIMFGSKKNIHRLKEVVEVTTLNWDISQMDRGVLTKVGERGGCLSGGQKARIGLARAIYANKDIIVLDDPLAAVDAKVTKEIYTSCLRDFLVARKHKLVILVTHQEHLLESVDNIIVMKKGSVIAFGSLEQIKVSGVNIDDVMETNQKDPPTVDDIICRKENSSNVHNSSITSQSYKPQSNKLLYEKSVDEVLLFVEPHSNLLPPSVPAETYLPNRSASISTTMSGSAVTMSEASVLSDQEMRGTKAIKCELYYYYLTLAWPSICLVVVAIMYVACMCSYVFCDVWIGLWATDMDKRNISSTHFYYAYDLFYLHVYIIATGVTFLLGFLSVLTVFMYCTYAGNIMHNLMLSNILNARMTFFDEVAAGRILNRFSKDVGLIDDVMPITLQDCFLTSMLVLATLVVSVYKNYWSGMILVPLIVIVLTLRHSYQNTARAVKRFEAITRSPVYSHISTTIQGLTSIRAAEKQKHFIKLFHKYMDRNSRPFLLYVSTSRWFAMRLDEICFCFIAIITTACVLMLYYKKMETSDFGLILTYVTGLIGLAQWAIRQSSELENQMISVERVREYSQLPCERPLFFPTDITLKQWPFNGKIQFIDVSLRYSESGPKILKKVNLLIPAGHKVGIVGRTGAGKSSLTAVLFRLVELDVDGSGKVLIDDVDIGTVGLRKLRKSLSAIPQDPILFQGTFRLNLDPFDQYSDTKIWDVLETVELKTSVENLPSGLYSSVSEGGSNLSVGTRQLICLARALLKRTKIIVIDEATANVDLHTDKLIQKTLRGDAFKSSTVLTIAHRLHTIMHCHEIIVMDNGNVLEFDSPAHLLSTTNSYFAQMVAQCGPQEAANLHSMVHHYNN